MMKYTSRPEQERAAQQERDQRAERTLIPFVISMTMNYNGRIYYTN